MDYISDSFIYFISDDINKEDGLEDDDVDNEYDTVTIGLLSLDHVNKNKRDINCVVNGKLSSVMYYVTNHLPILIEPPVIRPSIYSLGYSSLVREIMRTYVYFSWL